MAESVALTSIAKSALQLFTSLAKDEILLLWHSEADLKKLKKTIEMISCCLLDAEKRKPKEHLVQCWLSDLRKVMYDAEDLFDALAAHVLRKTSTSGNAFTKEVHRFFSKSNQLGFLVKTAHEIKSLRESLDEISKNMHHFNFIQQPSPLVDQSFIRKKTHSYVDQEDIIGRDKDKVCVINMLIPKDKGETSSGRTFSVVAIIGFGGLGKTPLAQFVYNDERVKQGFDECLWVCINYLSNLEQVMIEIIASKEGKPSDLGLEKLQLKLREIIGGKKFLIVLDDVWDDNLENWLDLETILSCGKSGSRILLTTRSREVAKCLNASEPYCDLSGLTDDSAWSLFVKKAFQGEESSVHPELERIGKKILRKCGNVPLAIVVVGSLLAQKRRDERTWTEFFEKKLNEVLSGGEGNNINKVLMVSYEDLPLNLKLCFASCSLFPKDHEFDKDDLVRLWLAQGILRPSVDNEHSLEEVGEAYFFHLVDRCFFQEVKWNEYYWHKCTAKMHDLLHDMAIDVVKTENLCLDKVPKNKGEIDSFRHINIGFDVEATFDCCSLVSNPKTVRTLLIFQKLSLSTTLKPLLESFTTLRTLYLSESGIDGVPDSIGGLIHLRYLDLSWNENLKHLPDSICKLHHLMILVLENCSLLEKLPRRIEQLVSLRQLFIRGCDKLDSLPPGVKSLTKLVYLDCFIVNHRDGGLGYLKDLDNLAGVLEIELPKEGWVDAIEDAKTANMARKKKLNELVIRWRQRSRAAGEERMAKDDAKNVLDALGPHKKIEYLKVENYGGEKLSNWFCTLKCLKKLSLFGCDNVEYLEDGMNSHLDFPLLLELHIQSMRNLKGWRRPDMNQGTSRLQLSTVSRVTIVNCPMLKGEMPLFEAIEYLRLDNYGGETLSSWVRSLKYVKELSLCNCDNMEYLEDGINGHLDFPSLLDLRIESMRNLKGWWRPDIGQGTSRLQLSTISRVVIDRCPNLRGQMPSFEAVEVLRLSGVYVEVVAELLIPNSSSQSSFSPLKDLTIWKIEGLTYLPEGWIIHLTALHKLTILKPCSGFRGVSGRGLTHLTRLKSLIIDGEIGDEDDKMGSEPGMPWKALQGLEELDIKVGDRNLLEGLQYLTSLTDLIIRRWNLLIGEGEMKGFELPSKALQNLRELYMRFGDETLHLHKSQIQHLPSLNELTICDCKDLYLSWRTLLSMKLDTLRLWRVKRVIDVEDETKTVVEQQTHLRCLQIRGEAGAKWVDDIPWISLSSSLQNLELWKMGEREQLPDGIQHLTSLLSLWIVGCEKWRSLPVWIPKLTSLKTLKIWRCSAEFKRGCERGTGADLIRHVPRQEITTKPVWFPEEVEKEGSRKKGGCGGLSLSKFRPRFL